MQNVRARRVITRGPTRVVGIYPSLKCGRPIHWESQLERDRILQLEFDPDVISYREQPHTYHIPLADRRGYTPDFEVVRRNGVYVEEVKPSDKLHRYVDIFEYMEGLLADENKHFRVVTEEDIRVEPALSNIRYLLIFRHFQLDEEVVDDVRAALRANGVMHFSEFEELISTNVPEAWAPWCFLAHNHACIELNKNFDSQSYVWIPGERK